MDLSKLPKMGPASTPPTETPPISPAAVDPTLPYARGAAPAIVGGDLLTECIIAALIGAIFLMLGQQFGSWLIHGGHFSTNVIWNDGPKTGQAVSYFDLQGGTAWLEMGEWVLGVCLLIEAALTGIGFATGRFGRGMTTACLLLGGIGAAANLLAIVMQIQAGFNQPIMSVIALAVGALTSLVHGRRVLT